MKQFLNHTAWAVAAAATCLSIAATTGSGGQGADRSVKIRPIQDFLEAQGKAYPAPFNYLTWADPNAGLLMAVDYAGLLDQWLQEQTDGAISHGTEVEGTVIERPLPDGRAEVTVLCHTRNAVMGVTRIDDGAKLFGHSPFEQLKGAEPGLGDSFLKWVFINDAPGAPLPDLAEVYISHPPTPADPGNFIMLSIEAIGTGPLRESFGVPDGTPGRVQMTEVGLFHTPGMGATADGWPAEHIKLQVLRH